ncbi:hypothetical protein SAMN04487897_105258 [Paenibacillus sp. yr247]|uniref:hypothetical protein n=1 Tax=Paenibacillus sp. yr247 TaxID=1761880 RepID=UPI0008849469|nr:hypothetical protein [Paenibacillus sp. yr247]SDN88338.1 hypothetical protein SAMN04487897_105258 [Paenibacillus sp. yr247]
MNVGERTPLRTDRGQKETQDNDTYLPPRKAVHPSEQGKWTRIFYVTLLWLFIILVVSLTVWGIEYSS